MAPLGHHTHGFLFSCPTLKIWGEGYVPPVPSPTPAHTPMKACIHDHEICIIVIAQHIHTYKYDILLTIESITAYN